MFKRICIVLIIILTALLCVLFFIARKNNVSDHSIETYNSQISVLENEKHLLQDEYSKLDAQYNDFIVGKGTVNLFFTDLNSLITENVFPLFNKYGFCGQVMLNKEQYPGAPNCMSREEFDSLLIAGWEYVLEYKGNENFTRWLEYMDSMVKEMNFSSISSTIYFNEGTYSPEYDDIAMQHGYNILVHHGENGDPVITQGVANKNTAWKVGAITAFYSKHTSKLHEVNACGGNIVMTLGTHSEKEIFTDEMLQSLVVQIYNMVLDGTTYQMSTTNAYKYKTDIMASSEKYSAELANKKAALQSKLDDVLISIENIKKKYYEEHNTELTIDTAKVTEAVETTPVTEQPLPEND